MVARAKNKPEEEQKVKEVTKQEEIGKEVSTVVIDMEGEAGAGMETITAKDIAIPFMGILQSGSPQVKRGERQLPGAMEGSIFNNVTMEVISGDVGIKVVPCGFEMMWVEWVPRAKNGGLVKQHKTDAIMEQTTRKEDDEGKSHDVLPNGNHVVPTAYQYVLVVKDDGSFFPAIFGMSSTQLKASKQWNNRKKTFQVQGKTKLYNPPCYGTIYPFMTGVETKGPNSWMGWKIGAPTLLDPNSADQDLFLAAKSFAKLVAEGAIKATPPVPAESEETTAHSEHM